VDVASLRRGARLRVVATEERVDGAFARYAALDAVEYFPPRANAATTRVYWYIRGGLPALPGEGGEEKAADKPRRRHAKGGYYDAKGRQPYHGGWRSPIPLARITSRFNPHRMHPVLHVVMPHNGIDFGASTGTPIYATAGGVVRSAGDGGACGNMVQIDHANGLTSGYCHLSRFANGLHGGQRIEGRQLIGYAGQTGRVTGPHLHFFVKRGETFIDPSTLRMDGVRVLPRADREEFAKRRAELDADLDGIPLPNAPDTPPTADAGAEDPETVYDEPPR
jgi:murein DD-endopeptidase MepM/ murein hydrolase activator NlpD